jgi:hypothetical protein
MLYFKQKLCQNTEKKKKSVALIRSLRSCEDVGHVRMVTLVRKIEEEGKQILFLSTVSFFS